jgi:two-component system, LytTR family, sensor kinase
MDMIASNWRKVALVIGGWTLFAFLCATQTYLSYANSSHPFPFSRAISAWLVCAYLWALLTPLVFLFAKRFPIANERPARSIALHVFFGLFIATLQLAAYVFADRLLLADPARPFAPWQQFRGLVLTGFHINLLLYLMLIGFYEASDYYRRYRERERRAAQLEIEAAKLETQLTRAQLDALRMQMHPHFLFNTLNSVSVLMQEDVTLANEMLLRLSELLRLTLSQNQTQEVTLQQELDFLRLYLEIERVRFQDRLKVRIEAPADTLEARVPNLILQPLVENAIRHAVAPRAAETLVVVRSARDNGNLHLQVSDNGDGVSVTAKATNGIGLANTRSRLEKLYGKNHSFEMREVDAGGVQVSLIIPFRISRTIFPHD